MDNNKSVYNEKKESNFIFTSVFILVSTLIGIIQLVKMISGEIPHNTMTRIVELVSLIFGVILLKRTSLCFNELGINVSKEKLKETMKRALLISCSIIFIDFGGA